MTYNVNGVRAFARKGGFERLDSLEGDIVCLQEVRATPSQAAAVLPNDWPLVSLVDSAKPGRNGVSVTTSYPPSEIGGDLPGFEEEGRWTECLLAGPVGPIRVVSVYVPTGEAETDRQVHKQAFLAEMTQRMRCFQKEAQDGGAQTVVCGDLNIAATDDDLKNWKGNRGKSGVLPSERAVLADWASDGWVDVARHLADTNSADTNSAAAAYTWWSMRGRAFDNDAGWRIDAVWATPGLASAAVRAFVDRPPAYDRRWSDHAALVVDFEI